MTDSNSTQKPLDKLDHPCKDTCSGWKQGYEKGQQSIELELKRANRRAEMLEAQRNKAILNSWDHVEHLFSETERVEGIRKDVDSCNEEITKALEKENL